MPLSLLANNNCPSYSPYSDQSCEETPSCGATALPNMEAAVHHIPAQTWLLSVAPPKRPNHFNWGSCQGLNTAPWITGTHKPLHMVYMEICDSVIDSYFIDKPTHSVTTDIL